MSANIRIHPNCRDEIWVLRLICCGRDDGIEGYPTWAEAQAFRESYTNDTTGHDRQAILSVIRPLAIGGESSVAEMARAAWEAAEEARRQKRAEDDARRAAESSALDAEMLEMVYGHDWIVNNLPGVEFVLVDRRFPRCTAVVHPVDEDDVLLIVTEGRSCVLWAPPRNRPAREPMWLVGARQCDTLADVGCAIHDWQRQQEAEDE